MTFSEQSEISEIERLCDLIRYRCAFCSTEANPRYDMHGLPIFELIQNTQVMTGVICRECQAKPISIKTFGEAL